MPKVREGIRIVERDGSHRQFRYPDKLGKVTIPVKPGDDVSNGMWINIQKQAGLRRTAQ